MNMKWQAQLSRILTNPDNQKRFVDIIQTGNWIVETEYKKQAPYGQRNPLTGYRGGDLQRAIKTIKTNQGFEVTTTARNKGYPYPIAVHQGTGRFAGASGDYPAGRRKDYTKEEIIRFMVLAKRGVKFSIPPNKFAKRTKNITEPKVTKFFLGELKKLINETDTYGS